MYFLIITAVGAGLGWVGGSQWVAGDRTESCVRRSQVDAESCRERVGLLQRCGAEAPKPSHLTAAERVRGTVLVRSHVPYFQGEAAACRHEQ